MQRWNDQNVKLIFVGYVKLHIQTCVICKIVYVFFGRKFRLVTNHKWDQFVFVRHQSRVRLCKTSQFKNSLRILQKFGNVRISSERHVRGHINIRLYN